MCSQLACASSCASLHLSSTGTVYVCVADGSAFGGREVAYNNTLRRFQWPPGRPLGGRGGGVIWCLDSLIQFSRSYLHLLRCVFAPRMGIENRDGPAACVFFFFWNMASVRRHPPHQRWAVCVPFTDFSSVIYDQMLRLGCFQAGSVGVMTEEKNAN